MRVRTIYLHRSQARRIRTLVPAFLAAATLVVAAGMALAAGDSSAAATLAPGAPREPAPVQPAPPAIGVGDTAPDFTLRDQAMNDVTLSSFRGSKKVILAFYVFAFTGG